MKYKKYKMFKICKEGLYFLQSCITQNIVKCNIHDNVFIKIFDRKTNMYFAIAMQLWLLTLSWNFQVPSNFRYVVEQTLKEFFKAIQGGKDSEQSWKKSIYKVISRLDDPVPEYFKSPNFLEQLE